MPRRSVAGVLLLRGVANASFAAWLMTARLAWGHIFTAASVYAIVDGVLGFVLAVLLMRRPTDEAPPFLRGLTFTDAALRVAAGVAVLAWPGLPDFPVSAVMFFGAAGVSAGCLAVIALTVSFIGWRHGHRDAPVRRHAAHAMYDPFVAIGLLALVMVGCAFVKGPPTTPTQLRNLAVWWSTALAVAFTIAGIGARRALPQSGHVGSSSTRGVASGKS